MIRHESIITALIRRALGLGSARRSPALVMVKWHLAINDPFKSLIGFTLVAVLAGVAAVMPARRASRLNVLTALQYE